MDHLLSIDYFNCQTICPRSVTLIVQGGYFTEEATLDTLIVFIKNIKLRKSQGLD